MMSDQRSKRSKTVTMRDVARLANVSQSTVSRVLSKSEEPIPIGEETRQRVLDVIERVGYFPNLHARSLRGQKTRLIAMLIADIANPFYHPVVRAVQDVARGHHYDVLVANSDHKREDEQFFCESIIRRPVDGVIMVPYHLTDDELDEMIARTGVAVAVMGQHIHHPDVDVVYGNDEHGISEATCWLIQEKQHRRIGFIGVTAAFSVGVRRYNAFLQALESMGLTHPSDYFQIGEWDARSGAQAMRSLLALPNPPTAVVACNDLMAIGAMQTAQAMGYRIPEDVAVVGFDDIPEASWVRPRLTTVAQHPAEMGLQLATALFERIESTYGGPGRRNPVPCRLIKRESA